MSSYIQNYGFTKTLIQDNKHKINNEVKWKGDYDGKIANIDIDINDNGNREFISMNLTNNELRELLGIQPVEIPLEKRLKNDFISNNPIILDSVLINKKTRRHRRKKNKRRKTSKLY